MTNIIENKPSDKSQKSIDAIAQRAGLDVSTFDAKELLMGMKVEQEHNGQMGADVDVVPSNDQGAILKIAIAHLREDPKYYTKLAKMESESFDHIQSLITEKKVTTGDFNIFLESLPKSNDERLARHTRIKKRHHLRNPGKQADDVTDREGNNDPTKTPRGKLSVARQARSNQLHPDRFTEAVDFVQRNQGKVPEECLQEMAEVKDKTALLTLIVQLLGQSGVHINRDWLQGIKDLVGG